MPAVRVLLLSDTHGQLDPRVEALAAGCEIVVHAGDVGADEVLDRLAAAAPRVHAIRGNNDVAGKWRGDARRIDLELAPELAIDLPGGALVAVHGDRAGSPARRHERLRREHAGARAVLYGHSHRRCVDRAASPWILNPGAAGRARTYGGPSCLVLTATRPAWEIAEHRFDPLPRRRR